jgi:hypothetical protein
MEKTIIKNYKLEFAEESDEQLAEAAIAANQSFNYLKFILTDDEPNANKQRVPKEEFANLIRTGFFTPLKMAQGEIEDGHDNSSPLGVITHLQENDNQIRGLAALWSEERPEDVELLKKAYAAKQPINISWEIGYMVSSFEDDGTENLHDVSLKGAAIVGVPAYKGRTQVIEMASEKEKENKTMEELEKVQKELKETQESLASADEKIKELKDKLSELDGQTEELETLREFKADIDKEVEAEKALSTIKEKFSDAGVEKEDEYFVENREMLLSLSEDSLDFMLQELVSFSAEASEREDNDDGNDPPKIPNARNKKEKNLSPKEIADRLKTKKE